MAVNIRCQISDRAAAKVAYVCQAEDVSRSVAYAWLVERVCEDLDSEGLRQWLLSGKQAGETVEAIYHLPVRLSKG